MYSVGTNGLTGLSATDGVKGSLKLLRGGITQFQSLMGFTDVKLKFLHLLKMVFFYVCMGRKKRRGGEFYTFIKSYMGAL